MTIAGRFIDRGDLSAAKGEPKADDRCDQEQVAHTREQEFLAGRAFRPRPFAVKEEQFVQDKAGRHPGEDKLDHMA